ncbi:SDR family NAD(P)-dependent oxidoreductase [Actinoplanes sp. NPDC051411]|jgi:NAD(P)-dependent dehydrogenase (short-subunit alcohol dehydrogenase family)|uniref:SDR family NAD(P)-dependent oxidoreductase n=1 Tax=Actinoplanes sp. NPDC051411 TaxID=3155522 RepID=UPI0034447896
MGATDLTGRVALVTGAAQGMGAAHAARLAADGATVVVNDRVPSAALDEVAARAGGVAMAADMHDPAAVAALVETVERRFGRLDVLVANHAYMSMAPFLDHDPADWWRVVDTNLSGTFHLIRAAVPGMRARGEGRVIVISSGWGVTGWPEATAYAASKAGLIALVKTLGRELAPDGVVVNAIAPGVIDTPQLLVDADAAGLPLADIKAGYATAIPLGRIGAPDEISAAVSLLADFRLQAMVGQIVQVNGGETRTRA